MRILCCLDGTNIEQVSKAVSTFLHDDTLTLGLLYVIDIGPHEEMERKRERLLRPHELPPARREQMRQAEQTSAQDILEEGSRYLPGAERMQGQVMHQVRLEGLSRNQGKSRSLSECSNQQLSLHEGVVLVGSPEVPYRAEYQNNERTLYPYRGLTDPGISI